MSGSSVAASPTWKHYSIVGAVVRRGGQVLLVGHTDGESMVWSLPAGKVEEGESVPAALKREILEETGLDVISIGRLAYVTNVVRSDHWDTTIAMIFEVEATGRISVADPDGDVLIAEFIDSDEAIRRLASVRREMGVPAIEYLSGALPAGAFVTYVDTVRASGWEEPISAACVEG
jgi:ADP-ribose pyrophosphatase YjhB (NUDIX family)